MSKLDAIPESIHSSADQATPIVFPKRITRHESSKIANRHLDRLAYVYVRQSQPQQVINHRESRELQYALADRAVALGWPRERVIVIDDDQGTSATAAVQQGLASSSGHVRPYRHRARRLRCGL